MKNPRPYLIEGIVRFQLEHPNCTDKEISKGRSVSEQTISRYKNTPDYLEAWKSATSTATERFEKVMSKSINLINDLIPKASLSPKDARNWVETLIKLVQTGLPSRQSIDMTSKTEVITTDLSLKERITRFEQAVQVLSKQKEQLPEGKEGQSDV